MRTPLALLTAAAVLATPAVSQQPQRLTYLNPRDVQEAARQHPEIVEEFGSEAALRLGHLGYDSVTLRIGDGSRGWAEHAPFDRILVTAAAKQPPEPLLDQLRPGGRLVLPIGPEEVQQLTVIDKNASGGFATRSIIPVRFTMLETVA